MYCYKITYLSPYSRVNDVYILADTIDSAVSIFMKSIEDSEICFDRIISVKEVGVSIGGRTFDKQGIDMDKDMVVSIIKEAYQNNTKGFRDMFHK